MHIGDEMENNKENKSDLRFEQEDDAVWVFSGDSHQGTEIIHLITSHIDDYNENDVHLICHYAANEIDRLRARLAKANPKVFVDESSLNSHRSDFQIIEQTLELVDLLASSTNVFQRDPESKVYPFESKNPRVIEWWRTACQIQELLTDTDPENCDFEEYKAMIEALEQSHDNSN